MRKAKKNEYFASEKERLAKKPFDLWQCLYTLFAFGRAVRKSA